VTPNVELSGISVVASGAFNPAIFHPSWFARKELLAPNAIDEALEQEFVAVRDLATFTADWLSVQVTLEQAAFSTVEEGRELDLRDLVRSVFDFLPETPVDALGLNTDAHFRVASEEEWHAIGDRFLPKDFWEPLYEGEQWKQRPDGSKVGLRSMTVQGTREDVLGYVRTEVAPSVRLTPHGVYVGVNGHFQLTQSPDERGTGEEAARTVGEQWESTRTLERTLIDHILEIA
jgi:hypothetical protein